MIRGEEIGYMYVTDWDRLGGTVISSVGYNSI